MIKPWITSEYKRMTVNEIVYGTASKNPRVKPTTNNTRNYEMPQSHSIAKTS